MLDITDRRSLEEQLRQSQKMEAIGQLAGGVAHDFNNLLTVINGYTNLLLTEQDLPAGATGPLKEVHAAGERATHLTRQLLVFSRKQEMRTQSLDLNDVVGDVAKMLRRLISEDIALQFNYATQLPSINADAGMIEQVLLNLSINARDAMPKGGSLTISTLRVTIDAAYVARNSDARAGDFVCLAVQDSGCGITPEIMPRIFEPFFTTKEVGKGTGLGLATVFGIAKQHQGWVEVESQVGAGTLFKVMFPSLPVAAKRSGPQAAKPTVRGGTETILLVEDEEAVRALTSVILRKYGYRVLEAVSGVDAKEVWEEQAKEIDLLLTDMIMPEGLTGRELAVELLAAKPTLKVIYVSGYSADTLQGTFAFKEGLNFLAKPYHPMNLLKAVRDSLDGK